MDSSLTELPARFRPLRRAPPARRRLVSVLGSLLWLAALLVLAIVVDRKDAVELAVLVLAASFALGLLVAGGLRVVRVREERPR